MATYKTPDVYVEEVSLFPPSVAEVETAIPAFIGYTAKAEKFAPNDLTLIPTEVASLLEYEQLFGGAPPVKVQGIVLDENNVIASSEIKANLYMYDCLRLFFKNGGGKCYIISIGSYDDVIKNGGVENALFEAGLTRLKKKDEPTIILFPDAVLLENDKLYSIQQAALDQCNTLQDRFAVFDLLESKAADSTFGWQQGIDEFRGKIGINYLKYGAAYTPWLQTNLGLEIHYRDVREKITRGGSVVDVDVLTDDTDVKTLVANLDNAVDDVDTIETDLKTLKGGESTLRAKYVTYLDSFKGSIAANAKARFKELFTYIYDIVVKVDEWAGKADAIKGTELKTLITDFTDNALKTAMLKLIAYDEGADSSLGGGFNLYQAYHTAGPLLSAGLKDIFDATHADNPTEDVSIYTGTSNFEKMKAAEPSITLIFDQVNAAVAEIVNAAHKKESDGERSLYNAHSIYKSIITQLRNSLTKIPPSGAIAGVYAMVDRTRGVWKAPANVSLSNVVGVTEIIDSEEQKDLNVDVVAGKSINAVRPFTGKGILVWGARTLAGNDNEWRYVSVRRFFNMVEESVKKSTYWAVFEPNDANTWIKVKSMIENYLTQKWRDGALAGAKPDQAFFVKVGLGTTMTAQDILEGRMNVEIGMAVVRPAEFIILKFSHKMQEA